MSKIDIKIIGVGSAGVSAINHMIKSELQNVEFISLTSSSKTYDKSLANVKINIEEYLSTEELVRIRKEAILKEKIKISKILKNSDMVILVAEMGDITGTLAAPIISKTFREAGIFVVGVVTKPFDFEGLQKNNKAQKGIEELQKHIDTLIVIPNSKIQEIYEMNILDAFQKTEEVLYQAVRGISDIITETAYIRVDIADVKSIMSGNNENLHMGIGFVQGSNRAIEAAEMAITCPLLESFSIGDTKGILLNFTASPDFGIEELTEACNHIKEKAPKDVNLIFGLVFDDSLNEVVRITMFALDKNEKFLEEELITM